MTISSILAALAIAGGAQAANRPLPFFSTKDMTPYWEAEQKGAMSPATLTAFHVIDQSRKKRTEADFNGHISLINFFFADCPAFCPLMMNSIQSFRRGHVGAVADVNLYSFTVQPEKDDPEKLRLYSKDHRLDMKHWYLLTGDKGQIFHVGQDMLKADGAVGSQKSLISFVHTGNIYLIDGRRRVRGIYDTGKPESMDLLAQDLQSLKKEQHD